MSITLGAATKLLDDMMANYSQWHTERSPTGKKVNSVEEIASSSDKLDTIMSLLVKQAPVDPNNVPLNSLIAQEKVQVDVNFIARNNFNNNAYRKNFANNNPRLFPPKNNSYSKSYSSNKTPTFELESMLKDFITSQKSFNKNVEEKLEKLDNLVLMVDNIARDVEMLKIRTSPLEDEKVKPLNSIQVQIDENIRMLAQLKARCDRKE